MVGFTTIFSCNVGVLTGVSVFITSIDCVSDLVGEVFSVTVLGCGVVFGIFFSIVVSDSGKGAEYPLQQCVTNVASLEVEVLFAASVVLI